MPVAFPNSGSAFQGGDAAFTPVGDKPGDQIADLQKRLDEAKDFALSAPSTASNAMMQTLDHMNRLRDQIRQLGGKPRGQLDSNPHG